MTGGDGRPASSRSRSDLQHHARLRLGRARTSARPLDMTASMVSYFQNFINSDLDPHDPLDVLPPAAGPARNPPSAATASGRRSSGIDRCGHAEYGALPRLPVQRFDGGPESRTGSSTLASKSLEIKRRDHPVPHGSRPLPARSATWARSITTSLTIGVNGMNEMVRNDDLRPDGPARL